MKAFVLPSQTQPAQLAELPHPSAAPDGVVVRVRAASVNGFDLAQAGGFLFELLPHAFPAVIGRDFAGVVEAVGAEQTAFVVGDEVFGIVYPVPPLQNGSYAELVATAGPLVRKPANVSFETAAAIPLATATALDCLDAVAVGPGDSVAILGATGGVGSAAVQLAAARGAHVIATAKPDEEDYVRSLGAAEIVDRTGDVAEAIRAAHRDGITALVDLVSRTPDDFGRMAALVRDGGRAATTLSVADVEGLAVRGVQATNIIGTATPEKLATLAQLVSDGELRITVQATFPFDEVGAAFAAFQAGTRGKVVLTMA